MPAACDPASSYQPIPFTNGDFSDGVPGNQTVPGWTNFQEYAEWSAFTVTSNGPDGQFIQKYTSGGPGSNALVSGYFMGLPTTQVSLIYNYQLLRPGPAAVPDTLDFLSVPNRQARVDVYNASDPLICNPETFLFDPTTAEARPYLGTLLPASTILGSSPGTWQAFSGALGTLVGSSGGTIILVIREADNEGLAQFGFDSIAIN